MGKLKESLEKARELPDRIDKLTAFIGLSIIMSLAGILVALFAAVRHGN